MKPTTIDEYIASKPEEIRPRLQELRDIIGTSLPGTTEAVKWGEPAFVDQDGMILVVFAGYKNHSNIVVTPSTLAANSDKLGDYKLGKGSVQIPHSHPVPEALIRDLVQYRLAEYRERGVKWM